MIERVEAHGGRRGSRAYGRYATVEIGSYNRDNNLSAAQTNNQHQLGYHHHSTRNSHPCPVSLGFDTSLVPWPEIKYSCVRVLELYCKVFDQQELYELIVRYCQQTCLTKKKRALKKFLWCSSENYCKCAPLANHLEFEKKEIK